MEADGAPAKKPYKELTLVEKVELIRLAERHPTLSQAAIAEKYEIAKSNVCRILQRRREYLDAYASDCYGAHRKRKLRPPHNATVKVERVNDDQEPGAKVSRNEATAADGKCALLILYYTLTLAHVPSARTFTIADNTTVCCWVWC